MSVPTAPQINIRPKAYVDAVRMSWAAPASDGGSAITGYTITMAGGGTQSLGPTVRDYLWTGLTKGESYTFSITAENGNGSSPSATFRTVYACERATAAQTPSASVAGASSISVTWNAPEFTNGGPIGWYIVKSESDNINDPVITKTTKEDATERIVRGLNEASSYTFKIYAVNDAGYSPSATSAAVSFGGSIKLVPSTGIGINGPSNVVIEQLYTCDITVNNIETNHVYYMKLFDSVNNIEISSISFSSSKGTTKLVSNPVTIPNTLSIGDVFYIVARVYDTDGTTLLAQRTLQYPVTVTG